MKNLWRKRRLLLSRVPELLEKKRYQAFFCTRRKEFYQAFSLVYRRYLACQLIRPNEKEIFYTLYQALPESRVCVSCGPDPSQITSTATIVIDSPLGLPSDSTYHQELNRLRDKGRKLAEITCLAAEKDFCYRNGLLFVLRLLYHYAVRKKVTDFVISIHPKHREFYEKIFLFKPIGPIKNYKNLYNAPAILEHLDLTTVKEKFYEAYGDFPEGKIFADFFLKISFLSDIEELSKVKNMKSRDFWYFFMKFETLFPSFPPDFQAFFAINFDLVLQEKIDEEIGEETEEEKLLEIA